jgi:uncharacterized SAM-binding protein YcdF (DUF218 family)
MIVGGQGHTTGTLRCSLRGRMRWDDIESSTEAALLDRYLRERHGRTAYLLEHDSTNCGSNAGNAVALLRARRLRHDRLILVQDATMQQRAGGCGPMLRTSPAVPICAEHPASAETLGNWGCPDVPRRPDVPR